MTTRVEVVMPARILPRITVALPDEEPLPSGDGELSYGALVAILEDF